MRMFASREARLWPERLVSQADTNRRERAVVASTRAAPQPPRRAFMRLRMRAWASGVPSWKVPNSLSMGTGRLP